ncbi:MAG TPA: glycosyltransferase family 4 protein [Cyclobacteriaceae bacterium]|nr:glycosyltransferase family 4 protein [Cyclobacteriaceae bacterium]
MPSAKTQDPVPNTEVQSLKRVLIITYYWPPSGGSGVQRWLKFVKYLPQFGWEPIVFTPENPSFEVRDDSLLNDVPAVAEIIHFPIWEPYKLFNFIASVFGKKKINQVDVVSTGKKSFFQKITGWIRGNLFIPDARIFWVKPSVTILTDLIQSNKVNTIITTGPPHSLHLIGLKLKKKNPSLSWIADMRDPWSEWDLLDTLSLSQWARRRHQKLEKAVLTSADKVITIAPYHVKRFEALGGKKVELITNGYDEEDFKDIQRIRTEKFTIRHIGMVDELRDPRPFMNAVRTLAGDPEFQRQTKIEFIGSVNSAFIEFVKEDALLSQMVVFTKTVPHAELLKLYGGTDIQLLILAHTALAPGNLPGKFFEYLASGNFILGIGPENGDAAEILKQSNAGEMIERNNDSRTQSLLLKRFELWKKGMGAEIRDVSPFARKALTQQLVNMLQ